MLDEGHATPASFARRQIDANVYTWGRVGRHNVGIGSGIAQPDEGYDSRTVSTLLNIVQAEPRVRLMMTNRPARRLLL